MKITRHAHLLWVCHIHIVMMPIEIKKPCGPPSMRITRLFWSGNKVYFVLFLLVLFDKSKGKDDADNGEDYHADITVADIGHRVVGICHADRHQ